MSELILSMMHTIMLFVSQVNQAIVAASRISNDSFRALKNKGIYFRVRPGFMDCPYQRCGQQDIAILRVAITRIF